MRLSILHFLNLSSLLTWKMPNLFWFSSCPSGHSLCLPGWLLPGQLLHSPLLLTSLPLCSRKILSTSKVSSATFLLMASKFLPRDEFRTPSKFPDPHRTRHTWNRAGLGSVKGLENYLRPVSHIQDPLTDGSIHSFSISTTPF